MTTIINTPGNNSDSGGGAAIVFGLIIVLALGALFYVYALPQLRSDTKDTTTTEIKVELPTTPAPTGAPAPTTGQ
jgi:hypothetical protein